ncbi:MAG: hypothetical protein WD981_05665 [Gaiellaceae bacterium]
MSKHSAADDPNDPTTIEGAIHAAVERERLQTGDRFSVGMIEGEVGEHNSPWHITYTATIERIEG